MRRVEVLLVAAFERNMGGDQRAVLEDANLVGEYVNIEDTATCGVGDAVEIAADAHHALMGEPSFELQHRAIGSKWQWLQRRLFFGEGLVDDPLRGRVHTRIGDRVEPVTELDIEVVEIAERGAEEEVLTNVAERTLNLALGLRTIRPAGTRLEAIMPRKVEKGAVVDDKTIRVFPDHRRLHAVVENLARHTADRLERGDVAAQNRLQILVDDEPRPDQARIAEHHREQPDDARHPGLVGELNFEPGEIDLGLLAGRGLEPHLERGDRIGPDVAHGALHRGVAAGVTPLSQLRHSRTAVRPGKAVSRSPRYGRNGSVLFCRSGRGP